MPRKSDRHDWGQERRRGRRDTNQKLEYIIRLLKESRQREQLMAGHLDDVKAAVQETRGVVQSTVVLIEQLAAKVDEVQNPEEAKAVAAEMRELKDQLAAAVAAHPQV